MDIFDDKSLSVCLLFYFSFHYTEISLFISLSLYLFSPLYIFNNLQESTNIATYLLRIKLHQSELLTQTNHKYLLKFFKGKFIFIMMYCSSITLM